MYDDGANSGNLDCAPTDMSDCWGHRENILGLISTRRSTAGPS